MREHLDGSDSLEMHKLGPVPEGVGLTLIAKAFCIDICLGIVVEQLELDVLGLAGLDDNIKLVRILHELLGSHSSCLVREACGVDSSLKVAVNERWCVGTSIGNSMPAGGKLTECSCQCQVR